MNPSQTTPAMIAKLLTHFRIQVETPAFQELTYDPKTEEYSYSEPDISDGTRAVVVWDRRAENDPTNKYDSMILFIEGRSEITITENLAKSFSETNYDVDQFIKNAQDEY